MVRICQFIREIFKEGDNAVKVRKLDMKTNKHPFQRMLKNTPSSVSIFPIS